MGLRDISGKGYPRVGSLAESMYSNRIGGEMTKTLSLPRVVGKVALHWESKDLDSCHESFPSIFPLNERKIRNRSLKNGGALAEVREADALGESILWSQRESIVSRV